MMSQTPSKKSRLSTPRKSASKRDVVMEEESPFPHSSPGVVTKTPKTGGSSTMAGRARQRKANKEA